MIHLDTSFLIRALVADTAQDLLLRDLLTRREPLGISCIAWSEFLCGPLQPPQLVLASRLVPRREPFGDSDASMAARLFNLGGRRRGSLGDCMIAATAIRCEAALATDNPGDFGRLEAAGLQLVPV
jgi:predicted nucleic acid-binding protein